MKSRLIRFWLLVICAFGYLTAHAETPASVSEQALKELEQALSEVENDLDDNIPDNSKLKRAQFTHLVEQYEPKDDIIAINRSEGKMYFFTEFVNFTGKTIKHRWEYNGKVMAEIGFPVTASPFRSHSSKNIPAYAVGEWTVVVTDETGQVLTRKTIDVTK